MTTIETKTRLQLLTDCIVSGKAEKKGAIVSAIQADARILTAMGKAQPAPLVAPKATPAKKAANPAQLRKQKLEK